MKYFIRAQSKVEYKQLSQVLDSFKDEVRIVAYSHDRFYFVAEISSKKILDELNTEGNLKVEPESSYLKVKKSLMQ